MFLQNIVNNRGRVLHVFHPIFRSLVISLSNFRLHVILAFWRRCKYLFLASSQWRKLRTIFKFSLILHYFERISAYCAISECLFVCCRKTIWFFPLEVRKSGSPGDDIVNRNKQTAQWLMPSQGTDRHVPLFCCGFLGWRGWNWRTSLHV